MSDDCNEASNISDDSCPHQIISDVRRITSSPLHVCAGDDIEEYIQLSDESYCDNGDTDESNDVSQHQFGI